MVQEASARDYLGAVARRLDAAAHGESGSIAREAAAFLGWSTTTLYQRLSAEVGWSSGRKTRNDKGSTKVGAEALLMLGATQRESVRANGKQILYVPDAASILEQNGVDLPVSNSHLNRLLRDRRLNVDAQRQANAPHKLRSLHPNHVHQVDPSLCVLYYMKGRQSMMEADKFYKNKLENYAKIKLKVWRYVLYDHTTAMLVVRYYEAAGENTATLFEFLMWAWGQQPGREFHGVPLILMWDKGSANTSGPIKNLLTGLEVRPIEHAAGQARVKGGVENGNNITECKFESRLKFEPVNSVEELNAACLAWQNAFNANLIPRQDTCLRRHGMTPTARLDLWRKIAADQLRILPPVEVCRPLLEGREDLRKVQGRSGGLSITYRHPAAGSTRIYCVAGLDGICAGDMLAVRPLLFGDCAIHARVERYDGGDLFYKLEPEAAPDEFGMHLTSPVIGEAFKALPDTALERAAKDMDALAYPGLDAAEVTRARQKQQAPFGGQMNAHSHLADIAHPIGLPRRGTALTVPERVQIETRPLNHIQMAQALSRLVAGWNGETYQLMSRLYPQGVPEDELDAVATRLAQAPKLVAMAGG